MCGWIKLHRSMLQNELWEAEPFTYAQAWIDILLNTNYQPKNIIIRGISLTINRGQLGWSEVTMGERWKWSRDKVRRYLKRLENTSMIIQQKTQVTTIITVCNYSSFQSLETSDDTASDTSGNTSGNTSDDTQHKKLRSKEVKNSGKPLLALTTWMENLKAENEKPIPETDTIFQYAEDAGIPTDWLRLVWVEFKTEFTDNGKKQKDWRSHFRNFVRKNYYKLWWLDNGSYQLTSRGQQAMAAMKSQDSRGEK